jgi:methyl-accepting chemotaxis protein
MFNSRNKATLQDALGQAAAISKSQAEISQLNGISLDVVSALNAIKQAIEHVNEFVTSTAAAVEEQSTVTSDMSENMQRAARELAA